MHPIIHICTCIYPPTIYYIVWLLWMARDWLCSGIEYSSLIKDYVVHKNKLWENRKYSLIFEENNICHCRRFTTCPPSISMHAFILRNYVLFQRFPDVFKLFHRAFQPLINKKSFITLKLLILTIKLLNYARPTVYQLYLLSFVFRRVNISSTLRSYFLPFALYIQALSLDISEIWRIHPSFVKRERCRSWSWTGGTR